MITLSVHTESVNEGPSRELGNHTQAYPRWIDRYTRDAALQARSPKKTRAEIRAGIRHYQHVDRGRLGWMKPGMDRATSAPNW